MRRTVGMMACVGEVELVLMFKEKLFTIKSCGIFDNGIPLEVI